MRTAAAVAMVANCPINPSRAHSDSEARVDLTVTPGRVQGRWHAAVRDLDHVLGIDADGDARITRGEWEARQCEATRYFQDHLKLLTEGRLVPMTTGEWSLAQTWQGLAATLEFSARQPAKGDTLGFEYHAFFEGDPWHRARVVLTSHDGRTVTELLSPVRTRLVMIPAQPHPRPRTLQSQIWTICAAAAMVICLFLIRAQREAPVRHVRVDRSPA